MKNLTSFHNTFFAFMKGTIFFNNTSKKNCLFFEKKTSNPLHYSNKILYL